VVLGVIFAVASPIGGVLLIVGLLLLYVVIGAMNGD